MGTTRIRSRATPKRRANWSASERELGRTTSARCSSSRRQRGEPRRDRAQAPGRQARGLPRRGRARGPRAPGARTSRSARAPPGRRATCASRASSSPSRDIPKRWSSRADSRRSVHGENSRTRTPVRFEVPAGLDQLVLAAAGRLEGDGRRVQEHGARRAVALAPRGQPRRRRSDGDRAIGRMRSSCAGPRSPVLPPPQPALDAVRQRRARDLSQRRHGLPVDRGPDGLLQARRGPRRSRADRAAARSLGSARRPVRSGRSDIRGPVTGTEQTEVAAVDLQGEVVFGVPLVELDLQAVILAGDDQPLALGPPSPPARQLRERRAPDQRAATRPSGRAIAGPRASGRAGARDGRRRSASSPASSCAATTRRGTRRSPGRRRRPPRGTGPRRPDGPGSGAPARIGPPSRGRTGSRRSRAGSRTSRGSRGPRARRRGSGSSGRAARRSPSARSRSSARIRWARSRLTRLASGSR